MAPVIDITDHVVIVTEPLEGADHRTVQVDTVIGETRSFADASVGLFISAFGSVVVSDPPPAERIKSKLFCPVAPFVSARVIVTMYTELGV